MTKVDNVISIHIKEFDILYKSIIDDNIDDEELIKFKHAALYKAFDNVQTKLKKHDISLIRRNHAQPFFNVSIIIHHNIDIETFI